jgi:hypothetical protein
MAINPIKTPQEMLYEEANVPHFQFGGRALAAGAMQLVERAVKRYVQAHGKMPSESEIAQLEHEVSKLSSPTSSMSGANVARMQKQEPHPDMFVDTSGNYYSQAPGGGMPTPRQRDYGMSQLQGAPLEGEKFVRKPQMEQAFDPRDEFLTHAATGRSNAATRQAAFNPEVTAENEANILSREDTGTELGGHPGQSVTPANDYIAQIADSLQAQGIPHDYTGLGESVMGLRPQFPAGTLTKAQKEELEHWRELARDSGVPETAIMAPTSKIGKFKALSEEMEMGAPGPEASMGGYAQGGHLNKNDMLLEMGAYGHNVKPTQLRHFESGGKTEGIEGSFFTIPGIKRFIGEHGANALGAILAAPSIYKDVKSGNYGKAAETTADLAAGSYLPMLAYGTGAGTIYGGKAASEYATNMMKNNPEYRRQMIDTTSSPMGGAMGGDNALAAQILNNSKE